MPVGAGRDGTLGHDATGLVYNASEGVKFRAVTMEGRSVLADIIPQENGFDWGFSMGPQGVVRYEIRVVDGQWVEQGYFCRSEEECFLTLEMTLSRVE